MKWTYSIKNKAAASVLLFIVIGVVLLNNIKERNDSEQLNTYITSIYEDRLLVENYNFKLLENIHEVIAATNDVEISSPDRKEIEQNILGIKAIISDYRKTVLTEYEEKQLNDFSDKISLLEAHYHKNNFSQCNQIANNAGATLKVLSSIQVNEGRSIKTKADNVFSFSKISSEFEMVMLIVIGIVIQTLVFASKTIQARSRVPESLN